MNNIDIKMPKRSQIEVCDLCFEVPAKRILDHVFMKIDDNEFVGLIGPNGSGKTSILKHLYRALPPEANTVFINSVEISRLTHKAAARQVAVMRQENTTDFDYTIGEMVLMGRAPFRKFYERDTQEDKDIAMQSLEFVGLQDLAGQSFSNLSGGEKQRVLIARSLAQEADILLLDEPTNHLDIHYQWAIMELVKSLNKTVLSVFHEMNLACNFCDQLFVLDKGQIVAQGRPADVCTKELLADIFRIDADIIIDEAGKPNILYKKALP